MGEKNLQDILSMELINKGFENNLTFSIKVFCKPSSVVRESKELQEKFLNTFLASDPNELLPLERHMSCVSYIIEKFMFVLRKCVHETIICIYK